MPPKKKEDAKKKDAKEETKNEVEEERELVEKELVIGYLRSKLNRYQEHGDRLQVDVLKLTDELETQKLNLRDINEFLTNELKARSATTSALEAKLAELNTLMEEVRKSHEAALSKLRADKDRDIERLEAIVREHERKARITQDFLDRKEAMETELQNLKETLARKTKEFEQQMTDMDRQHIQDREKWKREMAQKIKETKLQMMKLTDNQLEMTTKRTIMENEQMSIELSYQSRQTEKLLNKNSKLTEENAELRRQLELSKQTEEELARRNNLYQKTIKTLLGKLQEQGYAAAENDQVVGALDQRLADLAQHLHLAQLQLEEKTAELREQLDTKTAEAAAVSASYDETAKFLLQCMADVREKVVTVVREERVLAPEGSSDSAGGGSGSGGGGGPQSVADITVLPGRLEELSLEQRERVLAWLLERLHVYTVNRGLTGPGLGLGFASEPFAAAAAGIAAAGSGLVGAVPAGAGGASSAAAAAAAVVAGRGGGEASSTGVTLPPIPSFNRRQYASHAHGPLSQSSPMPLSAGAIGMAVAGEWGPGSGSVGGGGLAAARLPRAPTRELDVTGVQGAGLVSMSAIGGILEAATSSVVGGGLVAGGAFSTSANDVIHQQTGSVGVFGPGGTDVDEALAKVLSEVRPWGKRAQEQALTTTKHTGTFLRRGQGKATVKG
ncbi:hypothetical protein VOLCADRAFT_103408 [Volvox carteri f. nagariensis]|uniref:Cilia- and flagella-associated protein 157 n=1 Tax=Volvox carteri f. nagariensis TaxID=3068 RepID=D8TLN8_VOLCA|nr:uncharacterized protein VOLCADRAFT_103408 [Volvox carteri f. nagariensis]EFJ51363.1 hypothetical protein VOLCADRAFT_103408 [Volvox carteri f. nagariensis]|eukprot:XP_002947315.1 hypothetical protein VOLCADRAFT_103408 [Volvox carteri f. nagariensis]